jgi:signal transduction histidine kinase
MLDKVFDMFTQIDSGLDRAHGGLGIGLTLVKELVSMHQGTIQVTSEGPNRGSQFVVRIPVVLAGETRALSGPERVKVG